MITVKIASIPERISQLEATIQSFLKKIDNIQVYLNNYSSIPSFLNHKKICVFTSQEYGDIGDIGKFYQIEQQNGYILTVVILVIPTVIPRIAFLISINNKNLQPIDFIGVPERIRTSDLPLRRGLRYPAVPPGLHKTVASLTPSI